jgi:hypothetical protein
VTTSNRIESALPSLFNAFHEVWQARGLNKKENLLQTGQTTDHLVSRAARDFIMFRRYSRQILMS